MSDYMFMLESRLSADQNRVLEQVQAAAEAAGVNLFLAGGAMRDMLGGFQVRDLDFSVEGQALKLAKALEDRGARTQSIDDTRKTAELVFDNGVTAQIAMSRKERYSKTGAKPQVTPATIQEDLRGRDFTINAMALSLNRASRGLLLDPTNGLADLGRRELRSAHPYMFYDDPGRLLRLIRFRVRLQFVVEERTRMQFDNARAAQVQNLIAPRTLFEELKHMAAEPSPAEVLQGLDQEGLLALFSATLTGARLNVQALGASRKSCENGRVCEHHRRSASCAFPPGADLEVHSQRKKRLVQRGRHAQAGNRPDAQSGAARPQTRAGPKVGSGQKTIPRLPDPGGRPNRRDGLPSRQFGATFRAGTHPQLSAKVLSGHAGSPRHGMATPRREARDPEICPKQATLPCRPPRCAPEKSTRSRTRTCGAGRGPG